MEQRLLQYQEEIRLANEALVSIIMSIFSSVIYMYINTYGTNINLEAF